MASVPQAQALNQEIRALFQPDPSKPNKNTFVNQTPNRGYCQLYPGECAANGMFSIQLPVRFTSRSFIGINDTVGVRAPANERRVTVINPDTQQTETVEVRITGVGSRYVLNRPATEIAGVRQVQCFNRRLMSSDGPGCCALKSAKSGPIG